MNPPTTIMTNDKGNENAPESEDLSQLDTGTAQAGEILTGAVSLVAKDLPEGLDGDVDAVSKSTGDATDSQEGTALDGNNVSTTTPSAQQSAKLSGTKDQIKQWRDNHSLFALARPLRLHMLFGKNASINELKMSAIVEKLVTYATAYSEQTDILPLHKPSRVFGFIWDLFVLDDRADLHEAVTAKYLELPTLEREAFKPILTESKALTSFTPTKISRDIHRMKLVSLCSAPIPLAGAKLSSTTSPLELALFEDALLRQLDQRPNWKRICHIKVPSTRNAKQSRKLHIIHDFHAIKQKHILQHNFHTSVSHTDASMAMYEALIATMTPQFQGEMRLYRTKIENQGPRLLWYILVRLLSHKDRVKKDVNDELHGLKDILADEDYDITSVCQVLNERLLNYEDAGGDAQSHYSLITNAFLSLHVDAFTSAIRGWEQDQKMQKNPKCIYEFLHKVPLIIHNLMGINEWPRKKHGRPTLTNFLSKTKVPRKRKAEAPSSNATDITAFLGGVTDCLKQLTTQVSANAASTSQNGLSSNKRQRTQGDADKPDARKKNPYRFCSDRWGKGCFFSHEKAFQSFFKGKDIDKNKVYLVDGTKWYWCEHCSRMGSHATALHKNSRFAKSSDKGGKLPPTVANISTLPPSIEDVGDHPMPSASFDGNDDDDTSIANTMDILTTNSDSECD